MLVQTGRAARAGLLIACSALPALGEPSARFEDVSVDRAPARPISDTRIPRAASRAVTRAPPSVHIGAQQRAPAPIPGESWATARAREYVRSAERHERRGDAAYAILAYSEAIGMDGTFGPAILGLARLREALGDVSEAERLYAGATRLGSVAAEALTRRARMRKRLGREREALADLEAAASLEPHARERLRELASWYAEGRVWPAALSVWRRVLSEVERTGDEAELEQARLQVRALSLLAADADPVRAGAQNNPSWVRRSLANIARRQ